MRRIATITKDAGQTIGLIHGPDATAQPILVRGKTWRFDFDIHCVPLSRAMTS